MGKKSRAKAKGKKRFGELGARDRLGQHVWEWAMRFSAAFETPDVPPRGTNASGKRELLVVDGYNIIHSTPRYERLVYDQLG